MQADEECNELIDIGPIIGLSHSFTVDHEAAWTHAMTQMIALARAYSSAGYHKQVVNRLLEPFSHINVLVSATEWSNFFALRDHEDAEPHIHLLAQRMKDAMAASKPKPLTFGEWHLPFVTEYEMQHMGGASISDPFNHPLIKLSVARCASTSYMTVDGQPMTLERATALHDKLVSSTPLHASPCEHVAETDIGGHLGQCGNFRGFGQYRKMLPNECL
jgi:thymidylate synthase ThyX